MIDPSEIPQSLSASREYPHFRSDWPSIARHIDVFLDGVKQRRVIMYDVPNGIVRGFKASAAGKLIVDDRRRAEEYEARGLVTVVPRQFSIR
jgi:hypothetical protein